MRLVDQIAEALAADRGTFYLVDPEAGELFSKAAHLPELKQIRLKIGQGIAGTVAATGRCSTCRRPRAIGASSSEIDRQDRLSHAQRAGGAACAIATGNVIGVVQVLNARRGSFSAADEEYLKRLAAEAALAIENTSLYALVRPRQRRGRRRRCRCAIATTASSASRRRCSGVYALTRKAAATDATVLLRGESGTGKELIARAIHYNSARRDGPFVKLDCTTIPPTLMENELFGHERGAYTGAEARARGKCEAADGGTLFIDEIGELPLPLQPKILRFLQDREFERVGGTRTLTRRRARGAGHPPRSRGDGRARPVPRGSLLSRQGGAAGAAAAARARRRGHRRAWPSTSSTSIGASTESRCSVLAQRRGRGWCNIAGRATSASSSTASRARWCCARAARSAPEQLALPPAATRRGRDGGEFRPRPLAEVEREHMLRTLAAADGNRSRAAELLGIGRNTLHAQAQGVGQRRR